MANVVASFTADIGGYQSAMKQLKGETASATNSASSSVLGGGKSFLKMGALAGIGAGVVTKALQTMGSMTTSIVSRFDTLNNANRTFKNMGFATTDTKKAMSGLNDSIMGLPTSLDQAVQGMELMAASTGDVQKGQKVFSAVNDAVLGFGGSSAQASSAVQQLSQDLSSGTITAATWNSMINDGMGPALKALAKSMGMTSGQLKDALSNGKVSADQFSEALINMDKNGGGGMQSLHKIALDSTAGISSSFANLKTAVVRGSANMLTVVDNFIKSVTGTNISGWIKQAASAVTAGMAIASQAIKSFTPVAKSIFNTLKSIVAWVGQNKDWLLPLVVSVSAFKSVITVVGVAKNAFSAFGNALEVGGLLTRIVSGSKDAAAGLSLMAQNSKIAAAAQKVLQAVSAANPWVLLVAAIAAVVAGLNYFFTKTKTGQKIWSEFVSGLKSMWSGLASFFSGLWSGITKTFNNASKGVQKGWDTTKSFFGNLWSGITSGASSAWNGTVSNAKSAWSGLGSFFSGLWSGITSGASEAWNGLSSFLSSSWASVSSTASSIWGGISSFFSGLWNGIVTIAAAVWGTFGSSLTTIWNGIVQVASGVFNMLKAVIMGPILLVLDLIDGGWSQLGSDLQLIWTNIVSSAGQIWNGLVTYFSGIWSLISTFAVTEWNALVITIEGIWTSFITGATAVWSTLVLFFTGLWDGIVSYAEAAWTGFTSFLSGVWNAIVSTAEGIWNALPGFFSGLWNGIVSYAQGAWNSVASFLSGLWSGTVSTAEGIWNALPGFFSGLWSSITSFFSSAWSSIRSIVMGAASNIVNGARSVWSGFTGIVSNVVNGIRNGFNALRNINLLDAGRAIMDSFFGGLTAAWSKVQSFVGGIASWIRQHKGPISYDAKLLIPAGNAIMGGLNQGLQNSFGAVQKTVSGMASDISDNMSANISNLSNAGAQFSSGDVTQSIDASERITPNIYVQNNVDKNGINSMVKEADANDAAVSSYFRPIGG
ncbi:tape measure protein [Lacticaseibacillus paracasei]|uniref:Tape measure protein n=1 Tax=Lacticaseibacillus paracasei TaxID=1597 RepID=A0AAP4N579_LACPA|nr:tape measure protein [Lacticaseibacillus paracasei]MDM7455486.1 tape measure protein [Lacticaseibacillus paracasei]MDM7472175.1 tape measure protein [Lacticaseibacillus paracasei]